VHSRTFPVGFAAFAKRRSVFELETERGRQAGRDPSGSALLISLSRAEADSPYARVLILGLNRRRSSELETTLTDESAIAAPASSGRRNPSAATGMPSVL
jgi:hypothetical protein